MDTFTPTTRADVQCWSYVQCWLYVSVLIICLACCYVAAPIPSLRHYVASPRIFSAWFWHQFSGMEDVQWRHVTITPSLINVFSRYCHFALFLCFLSLWILPLLPLSGCLMPKLVCPPWVCGLSQLFTHLTFVCISVFACCHGVCGAPGPVYYPDCCVAVGWRQWGL